MVVFQTPEMICYDYRHCYGSEKKGKGILCEIWPKKSVFFTSVSAWHLIVLCLPGKNWEDSWRRSSLSKADQLIQQWWLPCNFWMAQSPCSLLNENNFQFGRIVTSHYLPSCLSWVDGVKLWRLYACRHPMLNHQIKSNHIHLYLMRNYMDSLPMHIFWSWAMLKDIFQFIKRPIWETVYVWLFLLFMKTVRPI